MRPMRPKPLMPTLVASEQTVRREGVSLFGGFLEGFSLVW